jgi:D-inositol-3-phosphate glycosyltransferase
MSERPLRVAILIPVAHQLAAGFENPAFRAIPGRFAAGLLRAGAEPYLVFDGPKTRTTRTEAGVTVLEVYAGIERHLGADPLRGSHLARAVARLRPDVIHHHHLLSTVSLFWSTRLGVPVYAEYNGGPVPKNRARKRLMRLASRNVRGVFFTARELAQPFFAAGALAETVEVHESPETTSSYEHLWSHDEAKRASSFTGAPQVLVSSRIEAPKSPQLILDVFARLLERAPDARLTWAALGGVEREAIEGRIQESAQLRDKVELRLNVPTKDMPRLFAGADVVFHASEREIGGTVLSESLSQGTPFVAFYLPVFRALAGGSPAVSLLPREEVDRAAEELLRVAGDRRLREEARQRFDRSLSFDALARARLEVYRRGLRRSA